MISRILSLGVFVVLLIGVALLVVLVMTGAMLGVGSILSRFFDVTPFQAAALATATAWALLYALVRVLTMPVRDMEDWEDEGEDWEDEDWEDEDWGDEDWEYEDWEEEESESEPEPPRITPLRPRPSEEPGFQNVRRNDPCPCGSGKKYKHCHGKKR